MAIGTNTFDMATLEAKLVTKVTTRITNNMTAASGNTYNCAIACPIFSFKPDVLAEVDSANPPPLNIPYFVH